MFKKKTAQEVWMRNQAKRYWKRQAAWLYVAIVIGCFLVVAYIEVPY